VGPERIHVAVPGRGDPLPEPHRLLLAVQAEERDLVARHLLHQVLEQGQRQAVSRVVGAVVADDAQQGEQIVLTHRERNVIAVPSLAKFRGYDLHASRGGSSAAIRRTSNSAMPGWPEHW
jgi:hypothetical protein